MAKPVSARPPLRILITVTKRPSLQVSLLLLLLTLFCSSSLAIPAPQVLTRVTRVRRPILQSVNAVPVAHHHATVTHEAQPVAAVIRTPVVPATFASTHAVHTHETPFFRTVLPTVAHAEPVFHRVDHVQEVRPLQTSPAAVSHSTISHETPAHVVVRTAPAVHVAQPLAVHSAPVTFHHDPAVAPAVVHTVGGPSAVRTEPVVVSSAVPRYNYGYTVNDAASGDLKQRQESRDGDIVRGSYTVADPDGRIRHVEYTADKEHGFRATVTYDGEPGPVAIPFAVAPAPVQRAVVAAPAVQGVAADPALLHRTQAVNVVASSQRAALPSPAPVVRNLFQPSAHVVHTPAGGIATRFVQTPFVGAFPAASSPLRTTAFPVRQVFPTEPIADNADDDDVEEA